MKILDSSRANLSHSGRELDANWISKTEMEMSNAEFTEINKAIGDDKKLSYWNFWTIQIIMWELGANSPQYVYL